jgi:hypothetical protein
MVERAYLANSSQANSVDKNQVVLMAYFLRDKVDGCCCILKKRTPYVPGKM